MDDELDIKHLECASLKREKHFLIKPFLLTCGHFMCYECIEREKSEDNNVECGTCNEQNKAYLEHTSASIMVNQVIKTHIQKLFDVVNDKCTSAINEIKTSFNEKKEKVEMEYQYLREEIEIRAESLKIEIDELCKKICEDIDAQKRLAINKIEPLYSDFLICEQEIEKRKDLKVISEMQKSIEFTQEKLDYLYQLKKSLTDVDETEFTFQTDRCLDLEYFGYFHKKNCKNVTIPSNFNKQIDLNFNPDSVCVLSNDQLIISDCNWGVVYLYNSQFKLISKIEQIDGKPFNLYSIATNYIDRMYISDAANTRILMSDYDFKLLKTFESGDIKYPMGICYANNLLYVCDNDGLCIHTLKPDLKYQSSFQLDIRPWCIQVIDNIACIQHSSQECISFFKLPEFTLKYRYANHNGSFCIADGKFYEYYHPTATIYCYNNDGTMCSKKQIGLPNKTKLNSFSQIVYFQNKFTISINESKCLIMPDSDEEDDVDSEEEMSEEEMSEEEIPE